MNPTGLADTGALLALLNPGDAWHERCSDALATLRLPLATTGAVLTELFYMIGRDPEGFDAAWNLIDSGVLVLAPLVETDFPKLQALMRRYADRPMDFADATLVHVGGRESLSTVFTIDNADFETYRLPGGKTFQIVPGR